MTALVLALLAGGLVGIALGALGAGGSILTVPALLALGCAPAAATTGGLVVVSVTSATALVAHARTGAVRWRAGLLFAAAGLAPAAIAGALSARVPDVLLTLMFAALAATAALRMLRRHPGEGGRGEPDESGRGEPDDVDPVGPPPLSGTEIPGLPAGVADGAADPARASRPGAPDAALDTGPVLAAAEARQREGASVSAVRAVGAGAGLGAVTGFLGVGGGFLAVPALVTVLAVPMAAAVGTSLLVVAANALTALAARAPTAAGLDWPLLAPFLAAAVLGAWDGRRLAARVPGAALRRIFGSVLLLVAAAMTVTAVLTAVAGG
ncbi:sulfite exporter TauE/SafE family protein [Streptomyces sp. NPDC090106]|uniref:sulfite exporter TauE/SafE family protein n=1 Tax=Streptomyces sp. NPDC090106 TaxID=3365946 RepID=UPI0037F46B79